MIAKLQGQSLIETLEKLHELFESWGLNENDFMLVDEFAYLLQGYEVKGPEVKSNHIDVYINPNSLPWIVKEERSIIPPKNSEYMEKWISFMQETGYSLDMLKASQEILRAPSVKYKLPNDRYIRLMRAFEMTEAFVQQTIMHYSLEDVGKEKIKEWFDKLKLIKKAANQKDDVVLTQLCEHKIKESEQRWARLINE